MNLVADAGPLIALAGIDRLDLLSKVYGNVLVPRAVHEEVLAGGTTGTGLVAYGRVERFQVVDVENIDPSLLALLDEGEASVIALAQSQNVHLVLIDEQKARKIARIIYGLTVIGSMRVLLEAKRQGLLASIADAVQGMQDNGYRLHDAIVSHALQEAGE